ncbi:MAG: TlpA family protein disulfide reductase [Mucilaginibacter sp.]
MKNLWLFFMGIALSLVADAQSTIVKTTYRLNQHTIVKDSAGKVYPYSDWQKMVISGNYQLKALSPQSDSTAFLLLKKDDYQRIKSMELMPRPAESTFFNIGQRIESFSAYDIDGNKIRLKDLAGKIVVLNFWFIDCPACRYEIPALNKMALSYANEPDVVFVAVALDYKHDLKKFVKDNPFAYHIIEYGRRIADSYGINLYPTNVVLDREGKVRFHASGAAENTSY